MCVETGNRCQRREEGPSGFIKRTRVLEKLIAGQEISHVSRRFIIASTTALTCVCSEPWFTPSYRRQAVSRILNNQHSLSPYGHIYWIWDHLYSTINGSVLRANIKTCSSILLWTEIYYCMSCFLLIDWWVISLMMIYERSKHVSDAVF
jgi:hypothetical protein